MNTPQAVLELAGVAKTFRAGKREVRALRGVSLSMERGLVMGLVGPDGAGKTTMMRLAAGLLVPDAGHITVLGLDATRQSLEVQASLGYMPQRFGLYEDLSVQENLDLYADLQGVPRAERAGRYAELMKMTGLAPFSARLAGRLSGGMKQKLGLACTLVRAPQLLLLDEPTVGVDPVSRRELWQIVYRLVKREGMSVLLSTAYLDEAERCDRVLLLHEGEALEQGEPAALSAPLRGRSFLARAESVGKRALQDAALRAPGVIDALIQGADVRLVIAAGAAPPALEGARVEPVAPRFEDAFVALLHKRRASKAEQADDKLVLKKECSRGNEVVIEVRRAQRRFGDFYAVKDVSFEVRRGEIFGLLGANGAGKSTTFRMLCGLLPASAGSLRVAGVDLRRGAAAARARIGYMSQKFSLYGNLSVRQNMDFFSGAYGLAGARRAERVAWGLEAFELADAADDASAELALGYKQRLAMACALMHEPEILFLDEPTSGVDPLARREFWHRINALAHRGVTVLVTTHFMEEAEYCDRLAIMAAGEILATGEPGEIKARARAEGASESTMEDAFIRLIEHAGAAGAAAEVR
ncbi:MAG: ATP-binding cassette domain-containing protein [Burkholderiales bacterium]